MAIRYSTADSQLLRSTKYQDGRNEFQESLMGFAIHQHENVTVERNPPQVRWRRYQGRSGKR